MSDATVTIGRWETLMIVNLSPTKESFFESLSAMRFASQINKCELGKPKWQIKESSSDLPLGASGARNRDDDDDGTVITNK